MQFLGFIGSVISLIILFAASAAPIPLYANYTELLNLTKGQLSFTAVMYFIGTVIALIFLARISNFCGRKIAIYIVLFLGILGCLSFVFINSTDIGVAWNLHADPVSISHSALHLSYNLLRAV